MSSDSYATISYTLMSSYEVIVNEYFRMHMDPLDPYAQLVMEAPPSPDYIPGPEAPPSPNYIPRLEYPEYLPPADDMFPAEEGDDDADDDGDDLLEDDADEEDEEESSDSKEEEEEHLALTVPAPALHSSISASEYSDQTEPFEEGETAATPPPSAYRVTARISVRPHIPIPFPSELEVKRLLTIPTPPLSLVSPTSYPLPPFLMALPIFTPLPLPPPIILPRTRASMVMMRSAAPSIFILAPQSRTPPIGTPPIGTSPLLPIPLPTSSFSLPLLLPSTSCREGIPEVDMPLRKKARFTTPTGGYEVGESSVVATARQIRPALIIDDSHRAKDRLIGRLRRERRYFRTLSTTYAHEVAHSHDYCTKIMDYCQSREKMAPKRARTTRANPDPTRTTTVTKPMTQEAMNNLIAQRPRTVRPTRECTYKDYLNYRPLKFKGTKGFIGLTQWFKRTESMSSISNFTTENQVKFSSCTLIGSVLTWWNSHMRAVSQEVAYAMPWKTLRQMMTAKYCPRGEVKKLEVELWNLKVKGTDITSYTLRFQELALLCGRMFLEVSDEIERYVGGLPEMIRGNVMSYEPKSMQKAIEFENDQMDQKLIGIDDRQADNKRNYDNTLRNQQNQQPFKWNNNVARTYAARSGEKKPYRGTKPLCPKCKFHHDGPCGPKCTNCKRTSHIARDCRSRAANTNNNNNNNYNNRRATAAYQGVLTCFECRAQGPFKNNCSKLGNRNQGNQNQARNGNAGARAYGVGTAGGNPDANVVMGMFLLNNRCALILFDTGADKSFMSTAFSSLINVNPSTLDYSYDVELYNTPCFRVIDVLNKVTMYLLYFTRLL
nr:hypothetical protein [Tanacetum cinerariifolium]